MKYLSQAAHISTALFGSLVQSEVDVHVRGHFSRKQNRTCFDFSPSRSVHKFSLSDGRLLEMLPVELVRLG